MKLSKYFEHLLKAIKIHRSLKNQNEVEDAKLHKSVKCAHHPRRPPVGPPEIQKRRRVLRTIFELEIAIDLQLSDVKWMLPSSGATLNPTKNDNGIAIQIVLELAELQIS